MSFNLEKSEPEKVTLETSMEDIEKRILSGTDINELKDIINIFNLNIQKKNIVRMNKLSQIQDLIAAQMEERVLTKADEFNNQDLLNYYKTIQETVSKSDNSLDSIDVPAIQVTQNQVNINMSNETLDRDSRERVMDAVKAVLSRLENQKALENETQSDVLDVDYSDIEEVNDIE